MARKVQCAVLDLLALSEDVLQVAVHIPNVDEVIRCRIGSAYNLITQYTRVWGVGGGQAHYDALLRVRACRTHMLRFRREACVRPLHAVDHVLELARRLALISEEPIEREGTDDAVRGVCQQRLAITRGDERFDGRAACHSTCQWDTGGDVMNIPFSTGMRGVRVCGHRERAHQACAAS